MRTRFSALVLSLAAALLATVAGSSAIASKNDRNRTISFYAVNPKESLTVQYMKDGRYIPEAMEKINWILRDWRRDEKTKMDPTLIDLVWEIHNDLGSKEPIHVISAYRSRVTNDMLRRTIGGQASQSRHIEGKAMDVMFPDVPLKRLRYAGLLHERGGVGYYPTSHIPFVHLDTDRVRAWPRATRQELALLFPEGRTKHVAADGGSISKSDVRAAAMTNRELATEIADLRQTMAAPKPPVQLASLTPSLPRLLGAPKRVERDKPMALGTPPGEQDRAKLAALVAAAAERPPPRLLEPPSPVARASGRDQMPAVDTAPASSRSGRQVAALDPHRRRTAEDGVVLPPKPLFLAQPAFDDEHFEDLSFNMFPAGPLLTATSSPDDAVLVRLVHPFAHEMKTAPTSIASFIEGETEAARNLAALANRRVSSRIK